MKEDDYNIILPLDFTVGKPWMNPLDETLRNYAIIHMYQVIHSMNVEYEPKYNGNLCLKIPLPMGGDLDIDLYNCHMEKYESRSRHYWKIETIPK